jgi:hypothetical protein
MAICSSGSIASGILTTQTIETDAWTGSFSGEAKTFLRTEIIAANSRERLVADFMAAQEGRSLPWQLQGAHMQDQPIRRAVSNPVYIQP